MAESSSHEEMMVDQAPQSVAQSGEIHLSPIDKDLEATMAEQSQQNEPNPRQYPVDTSAVSEGMKRMIIDLQRHWLSEYHTSREKALVELTEKLHQEFMQDQTKIRAEILQNCKDELEQTRAELEMKHRENLKAECSKLTDKHKRELAAAKKKQWCWSCDNEAIYHCCWNTAYCSVECQQGHWQLHRKLCRRKKGNGGAPGQQAAAAAVAGAVAVQPVAAQIQIHIQQQPQPQPQQQ